ncbi:MAG TPA: hypothetical protein VFK52_08710 [Nocardioidaceae bacterium]|nr:hypothetical protein [Nocardioidaceae bacterium]
MTTLRTRLTQVALVLAVPALAACSTNFGAPTDQDYIPARGVNERSGDVDVLNVVVVSDTDGRGTVVASLVNGTDEDDTLTGVTVAGSEAEIADARQNAAIPAGGSANLATAGAVTASSAEIEGGRFVEVVFTFQRAGTVTVEAPVVPHEGDFEDVPMGEATS